MSIQPEEVPSIPLRFRLAIALDRAAMDYKDMAAYLDIDPSTVSKWLNGHRNPKRPALIAWALRTGVPFTWLASGEVPPTDTGTITARDRRPQPVDLRRRHPAPVAVTTPDTAAA